MLSSKLIIVSLDSFKRILFSLEEDIGILGVCSFMVLL